MGNISTRIKLVRLFINGRDNGVRQLVQNIDEDLIINSNRKVGSIYREREHAYLGDNSEVWKLKTKWKRNSKNYSNKWHDFKTFHSNIRKSVVNKFESYV